MNPDDLIRIAEHGKPIYALDLIKCIVTVRVKTVDIVDSLPQLPST